MNHSSKRIIHLLLNNSHNNSQIKVYNVIWHNTDKNVQQTNTMQYISNQGYDLNEARKKSLFMLMKSPHLKYKGPEPLYIDNKRIPNKIVYAYLGDYNKKIMYTKYTFCKNNKYILLFNSWHESLDPKDSRFISLY